MTQDNQHAAPPEIDDKQRHPRDDRDTLITKSSRIIRSFFRRGSSLEEAIRNWLRANPAGMDFPEAETTRLVLTIITRLSRASLVSGLIAVFTLGFLAWQNLLIRSDTSESRKQTSLISKQIVETVRYQRKSELRALLDDAENSMTTLLNKYRNDRGNTGDKEITPEFQKQCRAVGTDEYQLAQKLREASVSYVRYLSEFYLLDVRVFDPLSHRMSEEGLTDRDDATSQEVYQYAKKIKPAMDIVWSCTGDYALTRMAVWNVLINESEFIRFARKATEIKHKYDVAQRSILIRSVELSSDKNPGLVVYIENLSDYAFENVKLLCVVSEENNFRHEKPYEISVLNSGQMNLKVDIPSLGRLAIGSAETRCEIRTAIRVEEGKGATPSKN